MNQQINAMLETGLEHTSRLHVAQHDTAIEIGSGDMEVLATPRMMALMENAAMLAVASHLPEGETTVGGYIHTSHLKPTPVGSEVSATAVLVKIEGRKLHFDIVAKEGDAIIGEGKHIRYIVNRERFLQKAK